MTMGKFGCCGSMIVGLEINVYVCMFWTVGEFWESYEGMSFDVH